MQALSSAEDLFAFLDLPYDQAVLNRARLHVMKRMGDYLADLDLATLDDARLMQEARAALARAHDDFVVSTPRDQKTLKIFAKTPKNIVSIQNIRPIQK